MGELMAYAAMNMLLGMGTVFVVLIFLTWVISLLKYVPALFDKASSKAGASEREHTAGRGNAAVKAVTVQSSGGMVYPRGGSLPKQTMSGTKPQQNGDLSEDARTVLFLAAIARYEEETGGGTVA